MGKLQYFMTEKGLPMVLTLFFMLGLSSLTGCAHQKQHQGINPGPYQAVKTINLPEHSVNHEVYIFSDNESYSKPPVLLLHELPGLSEATIEYAKTLQDEFTVYVPLMFGSYGQYSERDGWLAYTFNGEWWKLYKPRGSRKITQWLRHVLENIAKQHPEKPIGIIGMCLTGAMPLALLDNERVHAVVIAQPALPLWRWFPKSKASLDISEDEWETAKRNFKDRQVYAYGVRFAKDTRARREKHERMMTDLNCDTCKGKFIDAEIRDSEYEKAGIPNDAHSTLTFRLGEKDNSLPSEKRRREIKQFLLNPASIIRQYAASQE